MRAAASHERACDLGDGETCDYLARLSREGGRGLPRDLPRAAAMFEKACKLKVEEACQELAARKKSGGAPGSSDAP